MKNLIYTTLALFVLPFLASGQTTTENYLKSQSFQRNYSEAEVLANLVPQDSIIESVTYVDGLGRTLQTIAQRAGGGKQDIVTPFEYDDLGRQIKEYLPYSDTNLSNNGNLVSNVIPSLTSYYLSEFPEESTTGIINPYSETRYENSPLNRVMQKGAPGMTWRVDEAETNDLGHTVKFDYNSNESSDQVRRFQVAFNTPGDTSLPSLELNGSYSAGTLYKTTTKDENWESSNGNYRTSQEITNRLGQTLRKRTFAIEDSLFARLDTYYVYDDFGNLTYVLSPECTKKIIDGGGNLITPYQDILDNLGYQYRYDSRNRLIAKKVPGKGWESILYDKLDRPILTQDAIQAQSNSWLFTKYDALGRVAYTGILSNYPKTSLINDLNASSLPLSETQISAGNTPSTIGDTSLYYTDDAFPDGGANKEILTVNYYDTYVDYGTTTLPTSVLGQSTTENLSVSTTAKGLPTVSRVRVLDVDLWVTTLTAYDAKGRAIYQDSFNDYLDTRDIVKSLLDFTGKPIESETFHSKTGNAPIVTEDYFTYDHMGRLESHKQKIDSEEVQLIAGNVYDELGQLVQKSVGGVTTAPGYTDLEDVTISSDGVISKISIATEWPAKAKTKGAIPATFEGGIDVIVDQNTEIVRIGLVELNNSALGNDYYDFGFELYSNGTFRRIENGALAGSSETYDAGDIFRIERKEESDDTYSKVEFYHGNTLEYSTATFLTKTGRALIGKVSFNGNPGSVSNLNLFGPLIDKKLQTIDYDYNIRGWLTDINDIDYVPPTLGLGSVNSYNDLFNFRINYNGAIEGASDVEPLYNGNISQTIWKSAFVDPDNKKRTYGYKYDYINRITRAQSYSGPSLTDIDSYAVWGITYDSNGNIKTLNRKGENENSSTDHWDELTYDYTGNRLDKVVENLTSNAPQRDLGFKDGINTGDDYGYDVNGNMTSDENKNINSISYNHLNLPVTVNVTSTVNSSGGLINYIYDATGVKHAKIFTSAGVNPQTVTTEYAGNYIYNQSGTGDNILQFLSHPEGYVEPTPVIPSGGGDTKSVKGFNASTGQVTYSTYQYVFQYKDHLGNIRLSYADEDRNGSIDASSEIIEESNYYPFGLKQLGYNDDVLGGNDLAQTWKFGGKELNSELGFEMYDFGARNYDASLGRWFVVDALADEPEQIDKSPYAYSWNNPVFFTDPDGNCPKCYSTWFKYAGAAIRGVGNGVKSAYNFVTRDAYKKETYSNALSAGLAIQSSGTRGGPQVIDAIAGTNATGATEAMQSGADRITNEAKKGNLEPAFEMIGELGLDALGGKGLSKIKGLGKIGKLGFGDLANTGKINPADIKFSQNSVKSTFKDGRSLSDLTDGLKNGSINPNDIPAIRITEKGGDIFTLDNRRLKAFQDAGTDINYQKVDYNSLPQSELAKFTTKNGGTSVKVRGQ